MLIKNILAFFLAKIERVKYDRRPPYYPSDGSVEERRERLINQRMEEYQLALMTYHRNENRKVDKYIETLYGLVQGAEQIETYEDWEREMMKDLPNPPDSKRSFLFFRTGGKSII